MNTLARRMLLFSSAPLVPPVLYNALVLPASSGSYASTPDSVPLSITGDLDVRVDLSAASPGATVSIIGKGNADYELQILSTGSLRLLIAGGSGFADSTTSAGLSGASYKQVRVTKSGSTVNYYTRATGTDLTTHTGWSALGSTPSFAGSPTVPDSAVKQYIGSDNSGTQRLLNGKIRRAVILSGIGVSGTVVGDFNPGDISITPPRTPSTYTDPESNVWTVNGSAWNWVNE